MAAQVFEALLLENAEEMDRKGFPGYCSVSFNCIGYISSITPCHLSSSILAQGSTLTLTRILTSFTIGYSSIDIRTKTHRRAIGPLCHWIGLTKRT